MLQKIKKIIIKTIKIQFVIVVCFYCFIYTLFSNLYYFKSIFDENSKVSTDIFCEDIEDKVIYRGEKPRYMSILFTEQEKGYNNKYPPYFSFSYPYIEDNDKFIYTQHIIYKNTSQLGKRLLSKLVFRIGLPYQDNGIYLTATKFNQRTLAPLPKNYEIEAAYFGIKYPNTNPSGGLKQGYKPGINRAFTYNDYEQEWYLFKTPVKNKAIDLYQLYLGNCTTADLDYDRGEFSSHYPRCSYYGVDGNRGYELSFGGDERFVLNNDALIDEIVRFLDKEVICEQNVISRF